MAQSRSEETRARVLDAAAELFAGRGRDKVSLQEICAASGVSNGSIFHHFGSKNGVALAVYLKLRADYWDAALTPMEGYSGDPLDAIGEAARGAMRYQVEHPDSYNFMVECGSAEWMRAHAAPVLALNDRFSARWIQWATPHLAAGRLPKIPAELYSAVVFGPSQWLARSWSTGLTQTPPDAYADHLVPMIKRALKP